MRRYRFLLPLLLPTLVGIWSIAYGVIHNGEPRPARAGVRSTIFEIAIPPMLGLAIYCGLGFWAGWLYRRDREATNPVAPDQTSPRSTLPPPPPRPYRSPPAPPSHF